MGKLATLHHLKAPLDYRVEFMEIVVVDRETTPGLIGHVLSNGEENMFIDPADDRNLSSRLSEPNVKIVGRGVLVEQVWADEWIVAWRTYEAKPEVIPWKE